MDWNLIFVSAVWTVFAVITVLQMLVNVYLRRIFRMVDRQVEDEQVKSELRVAYKDYFGYYKKVRWVRKNHAMLPENIRGICQKMLAVNFASWVLFFCVLGIMLTATIVVGEPKPVRIFDSFPEYKLPIGNGNAL